MEIMIVIGAVFAFLGLIGLTICIVKAYHAKRQRLTGEALVERFKPLVALNLGSLFLSVIGLMLVILGISLS
ncbi:MAG: hypothetical protein AAF198_11775 [Pseudomonadota bacterium]